MKTILFCALLISLSTASAEAITLKATPQNIEAEIIFYIDDRGLHDEMPLAGSSDVDIENFLRKASPNKILMTSIYIKAVEEWAKCRPQSLSQGVDVINSKTIELLVSEIDPKIPSQKAYHCRII